MNPTSSLVAHNSASHFASARSSVRSRRPGKMLRISAALLSSATAVLFVPRANAASDTFTGFADGDWSVQTVDPNWSNGTSNGSNFTTGDAVTFGDAASPPNPLTSPDTYFVNIGSEIGPNPANVSSGIMTVNTGNTYTFTGTGGITATSTLKAGTGTMLIDNNGTNAFGSMAFTGANGSMGSITIGNSDSFGNIGATNVTVGGTGTSGTGNGSAGTLIFNRIDGTLGSTATGLNITGTLANAAGSLSVTQNGTGVTTLTGADTYGGSTTINAGAIQLNNAGFASGGGLTANNGIFSLNGFNASISTINAANANGIIENGSSTAGTSTLTINAAPSNAATATYSGLLQDGGTGKLAIVKAGSNNNETILLSPTSAGGVEVANTFTGGITLSAGTIAITADNALGSSVLNGGTGAFTFSSATNGILQLNQNTSGLLAATLTYNNGAASSNLVFNNQPNMKLGVASGQTTTLNNALGVSGAANITGTSALNYEGPGILVLGNANTYSGGTTLTAGELSISSGNSLTELGTGPIAFNGGTLQITGNNINTLPSTNTTVGVQSVNWNNTTTGFNGTLDINSATNTVTLNTATIGVASGATGTGTFNKTGAGSVVVNSNIINGGTSGTGVVTVTSGTLTLNGADTYSGGTTVNNGGNLILGSTTALGNQNSSLTVNTGGSLNLNGFGTAAGAINGGGNIDNSSTSGIAITLGNSSANGSFTGILSNSGGGAVSLIKVGQGTLTLAPATIGVTGINEADPINPTTATATVASTANLQTGQSITISGASVSGYNGTFVVTVTSPTTFTYTDATSGLASVTSATISGVHNTYAGGTTIIGGTVAVNSDAALGSGLVAFNGGSLELNNYSSGLLFGNQNIILSANTGTASSIGNGFISGNGSLTYVGPGTLNLVGNGSYTGGTNINGGTVAIGNDNSINNVGVGAINFATATGTTQANGILQLNNYSSGLSFGGTQNIGLGAASGTASTLTNNITTTGTLTYAGPGTLVLAGTNSFSSAGKTGTFITGGTLQVGNAANASSLGAGNISDNGNLTFVNVSAPITGNITGAGSVTQSSTGTTTLSGANTYSGVTTVNSGILQAGSTSAFGNGNSALVMNGGTLDLNGKSNSIGALSGAVGTTITSSSAATLTVSVPLGSSSTYAGTIGGSLGVTDAGAGTLTLSGINNYTGVTAVNGGVNAAAVNTGILAISADNNIGTGGVTFGGAGGGGTLQLNYPAATVANPTSNISNLAFSAGTVKLGVGSAFNTTLAGNVTGVSTALSFVGPGTLTLAGANGYGGTTAISGGELSIGATANLGTGAITFTNGGLLQVTGTAVTSLPNTVTANMNGGYDINNAGNTFTAGAITTAANLIKTGAGTLKLTGANTFQAAGNLVINGGTVVLANANALGGTTTTPNVSLGGGTLDLHGNAASDTVQAVAGFGTIDNVSSTNMTLTIGTSTNANGAFAGNFQNSGTGSLAIIKAGTGTLTLSGTNSYNNGLAMNAGTVAVSSDLSLNGTPTFGGATLQFNNYITHMNIGGSQNLNLGAAGNAASTFAGNITTTGSLTFVGPGTLNLTGTNSQASTTVQGTWAINNTSTGAVTTGGELGIGDAVSSSQSNIGSGSITLSGGGLRIADGSLLPTITNSIILAAGTSDAIDVGANTFTYSGNLTGTGSLIKTGGGTLVLNGAGNNFSGQTVISAGILQIGDGGADGSVPSLASPNNATKNSIFDNSILAVNSSSNININLPITGSGVFIQSGLGTTTLSNNNSFTGGVSITQGTLTLGNSGGIGYAGAPNNVTLSSTVDASLVTHFGTLDLNGGSPTLAGLNGAAGTIVTNSGGNSHLQQSTLTVGGNNATSEFDGIVQDGATSKIALQKVGTGILTLTGNNTYTGGTVIQAGSVAISNDASVGSPVAFNGGSLSLSNYTSGLSFTNAPRLNLGAFGVSRLNSTSTITNGANATSLTFSGPGTLIVTGNGNTYSGGTTVNGGILQFGDNTANATGTAGSFGTGNFVDNSNLAFDYSANTISKTISGTGVVTQLGGTLTVSGPNTYSGGTNIIGGTFIVGNPSAFGNVSVTGAAVANNGTIDLHGTNNTQVGGLNGSGIVDNVSASNVAFVVGFGNGNGSFGGVIQNSSTGKIQLVKNGSGTQSLGGVDSYTGGTVLNGGVVAISDDSALNFGTGGITFSGGTIQLTGYTSKLQFGAQAVGLAASGQSAIQGGFLTGGGSLTESGTGTLLLAGPNTYTGGTTINGNLVLGDDAGMGSPSGSVNVIGELVLNGHNPTVGALTGAGTIDSLAAPAGGGNALTVGAGDTSSTFNGSISDSFGSTSLTKIGSGTFTLNPTGTNNAPYIGATAINGGILAITQDVAISNAVGGVTFGGGTLQLNNYASNLSLGTGTGTGGQAIILGAATGTASALLGTISDGATPTSLTFVGPGTLNLTGNNSYSGGTNINTSSGSTVSTLVIGADNALGTGPVAFNGGTLQLKNYSSNLNLTGAVSLGAAAGVPSTLNGAISGAGSSLTFNGPGTLVLGGANNYGGATNLGGGELSISTPSNIGTGALNFNGGTLQVTGNAITDLSLNGNTVNYSSFNGGLDIATAGNIFTVGANIGSGAANGGSLTKLGVGTLVLAGNNSYTGGTTVGGGVLQLNSATALGAITSPLVMAGGTVDLNGKGPTVGSLSGTGSIDELTSPSSVVLTVKQNVNTTYAGSIGNAAGGSSVGLTKDGTGILTLTGSSTYVGPTNLKAGVLAINSDAAVNNGVGGITFNGGTLQLVNNSSNLAFGAQAVKLGASFGTPSSVQPGFISAGGSLNFVGPGQLNLNGSNSFTGTTITGGTLGIPSDAAVNGTTPTFAGGTLQLLNTTSGLTFNNISNLALGAASGTASTLNGAITGTSKLTYNGPGTLILANAANTYTGGTVINSGELSVSAPTNLGSGTAPAITFNGGLMQVTNAAAVPNLNGFTVNGGTTITGTWANFTGGFDISDPTNAFTVTQVITGSGSFNKLGVGTVVLGSATANTFSSGLNIVGGTVKIAGINSLGGTSGLTGAVSVGTGATLDLNGQATAAVGILTGFGTVINGGAGTSTFTVGSSTSNVLNINASSSFGGNIIDHPTGGAGVVALNKAGTGTLTLSGNNTYSGTTTVGNGTLTLGSATALSANSLSVVIGGSGTAGTLNLNGNNATINTMTSAASGSGSGATVTSSGAANLTINNSTADNNGVTIAGAIILTKTNAGLLTLSGGNTFTGGLTINSGEVSLTNTGGAGGTSNIINVAAGAILDLGTVSSSSNVSNSAFGVGIITGSGTIQKGEVESSGSGGNNTDILTIGNGNGSSTFGGSITNPNGTLAITKTGSGTITLSGNNTYSGATTISGGVLAITADTAIPNTGGVPNNSITFSGGALQLVNYSSNLIFNNTSAALSLGAATGTPSSLNGPITGSTVVTSVGPGILQLNGNNNYTGGTVLTGGELGISTLNNIGADAANNPSPALQFSGGILQVNGNSLTSLDGATVNGGTGHGSTWASFNGGFDIASATNVFTVSQAILGTNLTKNGPGTLVLSSTGNTYSGNTTINGGVLEIGDGGIDGSIGTGNIIDNATLVFNDKGNILSGVNKNALLITKNISGTGVVEQLAGSNTLATGANTVLSGNSSYTGGTVLAGGTLAIVTDAAINNGVGGITFSGGTLQLDPSNTTVTSAFPSLLTFGSQNAMLGVASGQFSTVTGGFLSGGGSLTFVGPGTLLMPSAANYTGGTTINGGRVFVAASGSATGTGPVVVNSGGELGTLSNFGGFVAGKVTVNSGGTLAPGDPATLAINGGLALNNGANLLYSDALDGFVAPLSTNNFDDLTTVVGGMTIGKNITLTMNALNSISSGSTPPAGHVAGPYSFGSIYTNGATVATYTLITADTITDNSSSFSGWMPSYNNWTPTNPAGTVSVAGIGPQANVVGGNYSYFAKTANQLNLVVANGTPTLPDSAHQGSAPVYVTQANGQLIDAFKFSAGRNAPVVNVSTTAGTFSCYLVNQPYVTGTGSNANGPVGSTKTSSFVALSTVIFGPVLPTVNDPIDHLAEIGTDSYLAPQIGFVDPPYSSEPYYFGESYQTLPVTPFSQKTVDIFLAEVNGSGALAGASTLDSSTGSKAVGNYQGTFLAFLKVAFGNSIQDPGQLTSAQWALVDGSYGLDTTNKVAWAVLDQPGTNANPLDLTVVGEAAPLPNEIYGGLVLMAGAGLMVARKRRRLA